MHRIVSKIIKGPQAQPLRVLKRPCDSKDGAPAGTLTTNEVELDQIAREAWRNIFKGNCEDHKKLVDDFFRKYSKHIFRQKEFEVKSIDWKDVKAACMVRLDSAGGLDVWTRRELAWVSDKGFQWLARWLRKVEKEHKWHQDQTQVPSC